MTRTGDSYQFIGRYYHALEQKGRLSIPAKFRQKLGNGAIVTQGLETCLFMFHPKHWSLQMKQIQQLPYTSKVVRDWVRLQTHNAVEVEFDQLGRILIPEPLRQIAMLNKSIVIAGSLNQIEIWDQSNYHTYLKIIQSKADDIAEKIGRLTHKLNS